MKRLPAFLLCAALLLSPALAAEGDAAYLTCGELTATAEDYAQAVAEVGNALTSACIRREVSFRGYERTLHLGDKSIVLSEPSFHWDCTIDGVEFRDYLDQAARPLAFYRAWSESELAPRPTGEEFQRWKKAREDDGGYLRFLFLSFTEPENAERARETLSRDEGQLENILAEYSAAPDTPTEFAGRAELFVPEMGTALRTSGGEWVSFSFGQTLMGEETTLYGVAKALPLTMDNYRELLLQEAWPGAVDPADIRLADGAEELDAVKLYEDWFCRAEEEGAVILSFPERARISEEAVIASPAEAGTAAMARSAGGTEEKFPAVQEYPGYADVAERDWFYDNARLCYEIGLMNGTDRGFEPGKVLTGAEAVTLAARVGAALRGETIPAARPGEAWYQRYADYLKLTSTSDKAGALSRVLSESLPWNDLERPATRDLFLNFLFLAVDGYQDDFAGINQIQALPDADGHIILQFYNWGILTGVDKYGTFAPGKTLSRAECAAMVSRIARVELRLSFTPADYSPFTAAYLTPDTVMFDTGLTAEEFLITINNAISAWEDALGDEFNWHTVWSDGKTVLNHVKEDSLSALGVTAAQGTQAYKDFDVQVYYSRLIDLTGETLGTN